MAKKLRNGKFACSVCGFEYSSAPHADGCRDSHQLLYIPVSKTELNRLLNAIVLGDLDLIPEHLILTLQKYARFQVTDGSQSKVQDL